VGAPRRWLRRYNVRIPNRATAVRCRSDRGGNSGGALVPRAAPFIAPISSSKPTAIMSNSAIPSAVGLVVAASLVRCPHLFNQLAHYFFGGRSNTRRSVPALASRELLQFARERHFLRPSQFPPRRAGCQQTSLNDRGH
jgi:hypothetical protein